MECELCFEVFCPEVRPPKVMPCGHTACLGCLARLQSPRCPTCSTEFPLPPAGLPTNFSLLGLAAPRRRMWCTGCRAVASARCQEEHVLTSIKRALGQQASKNTLEDTLEDTEAIQDGGQQLAALRLLTRPVRVTLDGGEGCRFSASCRQDTLEEKVLRTLVLVLAGQAALQEHTDNPAAGGQSGSPATIAARRQPAIQKLNVAALSQNRTNEDRVAKEEMLQRVGLQGVRRMERVYCDEDPAWSLQLLGAAGPLLEELEVHNPRREHLEALTAMPRLGRLEVGGQWDADPVQGDLPGSLQWLRVGQLPRDTVTALLRGNRATLRELWLGVGSGGSARWPFTCSDLPSLLGACGFQCLDRLVLWRTLCCSRWGCPDQLAAVRAVLPGTTVQCDLCDRVPNERF